MDHQRIDDRLPGARVPEWRNHAQNMHAFINKSANVLDYLDGERLVPKGPISGARGRKVVFRDGTTEELDHVVLCTGYAAEFPFLSESIRRTPLTEHYKYVFCNDDPSVAFAGFVRPIFGSIPIIAEVQSRWVARVFAGRLALPETDSRWRKTLREKAFWEEFFKDTSRRISTLVDVLPFAILRSIQAIGAVTARPDRSRRSSGPSRPSTFALWASMRASRSATSCMAADRPWTLADAPQAWQTDRTSSRPAPTALAMMRMAPTPAQIKHFARHRKFCGVTVCHDAHGRNARHTGRTA